MILHVPKPQSAPAIRTGKLQFARVALVGKYQAIGSRDALDSVANFLLDQGCEVVLEHETASNTGLTQFTTAPLKNLGESCDLVLVVGGDGTLLGVARQLARHGVPVIGINQGRLGFMTDVPLDDFANTLQPMLLGAYEKDPRALMHAEVWRDERCIFDTLAMNDVVVNRTSAGMVEMRIEVGGRFVARQRADGLIISTPTGSTAYALSAGGPLVHPSIGGWVMVPIAPHTLSNRPIVLPSTEEIVVEVVGGREISANFDMQTITSLLHGDQIRVRASTHTLTLLHPIGWSHFDTLRNKLHWNENTIGTAG